MNNIIETDFIRLLIALLTLIIYKIRKDSRELMQQVIDNQIVGQMGIIKITQNPTLWKTQSAFCFLLVGSVVYAILLSDEKVTCNV